MINSDIVYCWNNEISKRVKNNKLLYSCRESENKREKERKEEPKKKEKKERNGEERWKRKKERKRAGGRCGQWSCGAVGHEALSHWGRDQEAMVRELVSGRWRQAAWRRENWERGKKKERKRDWERQHTRGCSGWTDEDAPHRGDASLSTGEAWPVATGSRTAVNWEIYV